MKTILASLVLAFLALANPGPCLAMMEITFVSKERAQKLGIEVRSQANGPNEVWVELEFKAEGELKGFSPQNHSCVSLGIQDGKKFQLGYTALEQKRSASGGIVVRFMANRAFLDKVYLTIVVGAGALSGGGYELHVKDFVDLEKLK
jgi:hypothetical protein